MMRRLCFSVLGQPRGLQGFPVVIGRANGRERLRANILRRKYTTVEGTRKRWKAIDQAAITICSKYATAVRSIIFFS